MDYSLKWSQNAEEDLSLGRIVPELARLGINYIRQITEKPWKIYYRIVDDAIWILAVIDEHRNLEEILWKSKSSILTQA
jgi:plasmid stabilization system protein ParE